MLNIVIPMAGRGSRFVQAGYTLPKPLIPIHGKPMVSVVIANVRPSHPHRFLFLCLQEHIQEYAIDQQLQMWAPGCAIVVVDRVTEGAACTVLLAEQYINNDEPLMIANSDQWVDCSIDDYLATMDRQQADGLIMTMKADDPKWSYVRFDEQGKVCEVVEKVVVSDEATVGIYNFRQGRLFVEAAQRMIGKNLRVNGEFYVAPTYNELIEQGKQIVIHNVGKELDGMYGLGIPSDLTTFAQLPVSHKATAFA